MSTAWYCPHQRIPTEANIHFYYMLSVFCKTLQRILWMINEVKKKKKRWAGIVHQESKYLVSQEKSFNIWFDLIFMQLQWMEKTCQNIQYITNRICFSHYFLTLLRNTWNSISTAFMIFFSVSQTEKMLQNITIWTSHTFENTYISVVELFQ